ncbi:hypothetical protein CSE15_01305 [Bacillus altitudinis]|nr:hypothetical protein CSE15_01305 [Bacillus altitudinis]MBW3701398.1 hypothetical protein [Bacillus aerophilus]PRS76879.1 hypothetical protein C6Y04_10260 [Bacillus sp. GBSW2]
MIYNEVESSENILKFSYILFKKSFNTIQYGNKYIPLLSTPLNNEEEERSTMNHFLLNKFNAIEENVLYSSKVLYELLEKEKHIDQLFLDYANSQDIIINLNIERILYLSLTFLYSLGKVSFNQNMISRIES